MLDATAEKKFHTLKKRLDALHYSQPFTPDSANLVERLFNDLIKITEAFQALKKNNDEISQTATRAESALRPLQVENTRLSKENNALHYEIIQVKESFEKLESQSRNIQRSLEGDKNDLKFVLQQKDLNYRKLEDDVRKNRFFVLLNFL